MQQGKLRAVKRGVATLALLAACTSEPAGGGIHLHVAWEASPERVYYGRAEGDSRALAGVLAKAGEQWCGRASAEELARMRAFSVVVAEVLTQDMTRGVGDGLLLLSVACYETRFASFVTSGDCNRASWRAVHGAAWCDYGEACGVLSMHLNAFRRTGEPNCAEALADDARYVRTGLAWVRDFGAVAWGNLGWHRSRVANYAIQIEICDSSKKFWHR